MIDHASLKLIHIGCVVLSISGFTTRGLLMLAGSPLLSHPLIRKAPHYIDALLFASGLWMAINIQQFPGTVPWLSAKLIALVTYVVLGSFALRGKSRNVRVISLVGALAVFGYMVSVAITRTPIPWA